MEEKGSTMEQEELAIASVVEPSKELEITAKGISVVTNIEGLRLYVRDIIEPFKGGTVDISTPELEKQASDALTGLRAIGEDISRKRIDTFKALREPITKAEEEVKALESEIKEAIDDNQAIINEKRQEAEAMRHDVLEQDYIGVVDEKIAKLIPFDSFANKSWFTKSYGEKKAYDEMFHKAKKIVMDMKTLSDQPLNNRDEVISYYCQNLDIGQALEHDQILTARRVEAEKKAREAEEAFKLKQEMTKPVEPEPVQAPKPATKDVEHGLGDYVLVLRGISVFDAQAIAQFAQQTIGRRPELKNSKWMEGKGI